MKAMHSHCTNYQGQTSKLSDICQHHLGLWCWTAADYIVTAADLQAVTLGNKMCKYTDDSHLIVPSCSADTCSAELTNVETWARVNNLKLNHTKSDEVVFTSRKRRQQINLPPQLPGIAHISAMKILGVTISSSLSIALT